MLLLHLFLGGAKNTTFISPTQNQNTLNSLCAFFVASLCARRLCTGMVENNDRAMQTALRNLVCVVLSHVTFMHDRFLLARLCFILLCDRSVNVGRGSGYKRALRWAASHTHTRTSKIERQQVYRLLEPQN